MIKKSSAKGSKSGQVSKDMSKRELEVYELLTKEFLTVKQISSRLKITPRTVRKHRLNLMKKGFVTKYSQKVPQTQCTTTSSGTFLGKGRFIRCHGLEFNIKLLFKDERYVSLLKKSNLFYYDGCTIRLFRDSLEVYGNKSFVSDSVQKAFSKALVYFNRLFVSLESQLSVVLVKPRALNIRLVKSEFAEVENELALHCKDLSEKIRVYGSDDGKLWFSIDNSFNLSEAETHHPEFAKRDMQDTILPFFNDLRDNEVVTMSDIKVLIADLVSQNRETASGLKVVVDLLKPREVVEGGVINLKDKIWYVG